MESLKMSEKLITEEQKLAISPVKQDRLAIYRLEREYGASLSEIVGERRRLCHSPSIHIRRKS